jgi:hypothetical protein
MLTVIEYMEYPEAQPDEPRKIFVVVLLSTGFAFPKCAAEEIGFINNTAHLRHRPPDGGIGLAPVGLRL